MSLPRRIATDTHPWPDKPVLLGHGRANRTSAHSGLRGQPYTTPTEVIQLVRLALFERFSRTVETVRAVESGVVEEQAVVWVDDGLKTLIVRVWPVFFAHPKRVEYKFYSQQLAVRETVLTYLGVLARVNEAQLVEKP
jgi:hypothetical protein